MWFQDGSYLAEFLLAKGYEVGKPILPLKDILQTRQKSFPH